MVVYQPKKESLAKPVVGASKKVPPVKHRGFNKEAWHFANNNGFSRVEHKGTWADKHPFASSFSARARCKHAKLGQDFYP